MHKQSRADAGDAAQATALNMHLASFGDAGHYSIRPVCRVDSSPSRQGCPRRLPAVRSDDDVLSSKSGAERGREREREKKKKTTESKSGPLLSLSLSPAFSACLSSGRCSGSPPTRGGMKRNSGYDLRNRPSLSRLIPNGNVSTTRARGGSETTGASAARQNGMKFHFLSAPSPRRRIREGSRGSRAGGARFRRIYLDITPANGNPIEFIPEIARTPPATGRRNKERERERERERGVGGNKKKQINRFHGTYRDSRRRIPS